MAELKLGPTHDTTYDTHSLLNALYVRPEL